MEDPFYLNFDLVHAFSVSLANHALSLSDTVLAKSSVAVSNNGVF